MIFWDAGMRGGGRGGREGKGKRDGQRGCGEYVHR